MGYLPYIPKIHSVPREKEYWEQFFSFEMAPFGMRGRGSIFLVYKETGAVVAAGASVKDLKPAAIKYLDDLFEKNVLSNE